MTSEEFIKQQIDAGYTVHLNKGTWWQKTAPFFYKPVIHLQKITVGESNPNYFKSFFGYSHLVDDKRMANKERPMMLLSYEKLKEYSLKSLSSSKRSQVRKGLKLTEVKRIENIEIVIDDIKNICITTAIRTKSGKPPKYYINNYKEWREWLIKEFSLPKREWWGTYYQGSLIAYIYAIQIDDVMLIYAAKSHTNFLDKCPNDALIFTFLEYCKSIEGCNEVNFGDWSQNAPSLNEFKEKYSFERVALPVYVKYNPCILILKKLKSLLKNDLKVR